MKKRRRTTLLRLIFSHFSRLTQVNEVQNRNQILSCIGKRIFCFLPVRKKNKTPTLLHRGIIGAANQNRTDDLILTKDVLYRLSHSSITNTIYTLHVVYRFVLYQSLSDLSSIFYSFFQSSYINIRLSSIDKLSKIYYNL